MKDDELVRGVIEVARDEARARGADPRLRALALGTLDEAGRLSLARDAEGDPELAALIADFEPLGPASRARIAERLVREVGASNAPDRRAGDARPIALGRPRRRPVAFFAPLALAAGLALWVAARPREAPLPAYELSFAGGEQALRGPADRAPEGDHRLADGDRIEIVLLPAEPVTPPVATRLWLVRGADARPWSLPIDVSSEGAVRIAAAADSRPAGVTGPWELVVAVGRPEALPAAPTDSRAGKGWQRLAAHVTFVDAR